MPSFWNLQAFGVHYDVRVVVGAGWPTRAEIAHGQEALRDLVAGGVNRRALEELYEEVTGYQRSSGALQPSRGVCPQAQLKHVLDRLRFAIRTGKLIIEALPQPRIGADGYLVGSGPADVVQTPPEPGPPKPDDQENQDPTWFEVRVVDELGEPIADVPLELDVEAHHALTTDDDGRARLDGVHEHYGSVHIAELNALRELLRPRWDTIREGEWLEPEPDHSFAPLRGQKPIEPGVRSETLHTVVIQPWVIRARLIGMYFDTNKCFLLPKALDDIKKLRQLYDQYPDSAILVVGHTDLSGDPSYNDPLSLERADSAAAYLKDDFEAWLAWYGPNKPGEKRWGSKEDHLMIAEVAGFGSKPANESDVRWFQRTRDLLQDGIAGPQTRTQLITEYMALDETSLPPQAFLTTHGCGESFPLSDDDLAALALPADGEADQRHRRVELYFFDHQLSVQPPAPASISPPDSTEYPEWGRRAQETYDFGLARTQALFIRLHDEHQCPLPNAIAVAALDDGRQDGMADGEGWLELALPPACPASVTVEWGPAGSTAPYPFQRDVIPECDKGSAAHGTRARLHNIGYERSWPFELAAKCFQDDYGVDCETEPQGLDGSTLPPATQQRLDGIYDSLDCDASTSETMWEGQEPEGTGRRIPATPDNERIVTVGVTVKAQEHDDTADLPPDEVVVWLVKDGNTIPRQLDFKKDHGPRLHARFTQLEPGTYEARAYRRVDGKTVEIATPESVATVAGGEVRVSLFLYPAPQLKLIEARFADDHGVITQTPVDLQRFYQSRNSRIIDSLWGDGTGVSVKPEYAESFSWNNPANKKATRWNAASYTKGKTVMLTLKLEASVPDGRPHTLERLALIGGPDPLTFETDTSINLVDGTPIEVPLAAKAPLPGHVERFNHQLLLVATADGSPISIDRSNHRVELFVTLGTPGGKVERHKKKGPGVVYPEGGLPQKITAQRLRYAAWGASNASDHEQAVRKLFAFLRERGIRYYPPRYPPAGQPNTTGLIPWPPLHEFLWIGMAEEKICHCLDLAAGFRLLARILGIEGDMDVKQCFPWPPWDKNGHRRDLDKDDEPWQASLSKYPIADRSKVVFIDCRGYANVFESVLRYQQPGSKRALLLPIGEERIFDDYGPGVTPGPMDDRNASLMFQASKSDRWQGKFRLAVKKPGKGNAYHQPPFRFMKHSHQFRFMFQYDTDTIEPGDEEAP